jgi:hypothetical protein
MPGHIRAARCGAVDLFVIIGTASAGWTLCLPMICDFEPPDRVCRPTDPESVKVKLLPTLRRIFPIKRNKPEFVPRFL